MSTELDFLFTVHFPHFIGKFSQNGVVGQFQTDIVETSCTDILDIVTLMGEAHSLFFYSMLFKKPVQPAHPPPVRKLSKLETIYALVIGMNKYPADHR